MIYDIEVVDVKLTEDSKLFTVHVTNASTDKRFTISLDKDIPDNKVEMKLKSMVTDRLTEDSANAKFSIDI